MFLPGHSFGGATAVLTLATDPRFKVGVALDAWLFPVRDEALSERITQPLLFISTESFRSEGNLGKMREFVLDESDAEGREERIFSYIDGSVHQNHLDMPFILKVSFGTRRAWGRIKEPRQNLTEGLERLDSVQ